MLKIFSTFLLATVVIYSCSPSISPDQDWGNKKWILHELKGVPVQTSNDDKDAQIVFSPSNKQYSGTGGCNRIAGTYTISKKNQIGFKPGISTLMSCPDLEFEKLFLATLATVNHYSIEDNILYLKNDKEVVMKLR